MTPTWSFSWYEASHSGGYLFCVKHSFSAIFWSRVHSIRTVDSTESNTNQKWQPSGVPRQHKLCTFVALWKWMHITVTTTHVTKGKFPRHLSEPRASQYPLLFLMNSSAKIEELQSCSHIWEQMVKPTAVSK